MGRPRRYADSDRIGSAKPCHRSPPDVVIPPRLGYRVLVSGPSLWRHSSLSFSTALPAKTRDLNDAIGLARKPTPYTQAEAESRRLVATGGRALPSLSGRYRRIVAAAPFRPGAVIERALHAEN